MLSSESAQKLIKSKANKGEVFARFFNNGGNDSDFDELADTVEGLDKLSDETGTEQQDTGSLISGDVDSEVNRFRNKFSKPVLAASAMSFKSSGKSNISDLSDEENNRLSPDSPSSYRSEESGDSIEGEGELNQYHQVLSIEHSPSKDPKHKRKSSY